MRIAIKILKEDCEGSWNDPWITNLRKPIFLAFMRKLQRMPACPPWNNAAPRAFSLLPDRCANCLVLDWLTYHWQSTARTAAFGAKDNSDRNPLQVINLSPSLAKT